MPVTPTLVARRRAVHAACRQLGMDESTRRAMIESTAGAGVRSTTQLDLAACEKVLERLRQLGAARPGKAKPIGRHPRTPNNLDREPMLHKIEAMLADMELPWKYAESIAERQTKRVGGGIQRLEWVPDADLRGVVAALHKEKEKRLTKSHAALWPALSARGLTGDSAVEWCVTQCKAMNRLNTPWPWRQCLETLRILTGMLA